MANGRTNSGSSPSPAPTATELSTLSAPVCSPTDLHELSAATAVQGSSTEHRLQDDILADVGMSNAEFKDLGDALASFFAVPAGNEQPSLMHGSPRGSNKSSITSSSIASSSSSEDLAPTAGENMAEMASPGGDGEVADSATSPRAPSSDSEELAQDDKKANKVIKLPQRKGGMQLWQFLYALLSDSRYKDLIEWTANVKEREFRLHEPEAIAIWWGDHKNKRNMSYDKLSRSLRYYYDKGIIRKINGQRYVYRFCVAPEVMYRHIGNSDCRPKLKPMSLAAQNALSTYNNTYQGMMYPGHAMSSQPIPPTAFNGPFFPPPYPAPSSSYPSPNFVSSFCQSTQCGMEYTHYPQMSSYSDTCTQFQPHLLSPVKRCSQQPSYAMQDLLAAAAAGHFQPCFPMSTDDAVPFQSLMIEGTPSPQPISPCSLQSGPQLSPCDYSPHTSPPYLPLQDDVGLLPSPSYILTNLS